MDGTKATIGGRVFDFSQLTPLYGATAIERIAKAFSDQFMAASVESARLKFFCLRMFLRWVAARAELWPDSTEDRFFQGVQRGEAEIPSSAVVHAALDNFASRLRDRECFEITRSVSTFTRTTYLQAATTAVRQLARSGLWAAPASIRPILRGRTIGGNIPSFGELARKFEHAAMNTRAVRAETTPNWNEVIRLNEERLTALRRICVQELRTAFAKWQLGQELISEAGAITPRTPLELRSQLLALRIHGSGRASDEDPEVRAKALGLLVRYLALTEPHRRSFEDGLVLQQFRHVKGLTWTSALRHVEGDPRALIAAQTIVMIDTAFNASTCNQLAADPFLGQIERGKVRIITVAAAKLRARGKIQEAQLSECGEIDHRRNDGEMSGSDAIRIWQKLSMRIRNTARYLELDSAKYLWIAGALGQGRNKIDLITWAMTHRYWNQLLTDYRDDPVIGGLDLERRMIRPTVLQLESARGGFEHRVASRLAQHASSNTTMRYLSRPWFKALLDSKMRTFLDAFEASLLDPIPSAPAAAGTEAVHGGRLGHSRETGLGFLCLAPRGEQKAAIPDGPCSAVDRCASCSFRTFRATPESVRALLVFRRSLTLQEESFKATNPARWAEVWLSFQALCDVIIERLRGSHHRAVLSRAEKEIEEAMTTGSIPIVQLW